MDCLDTQRLISEALDRELVDAKELAAAKWHCRKCPECGAFVRAQLAVQRTPLPAQPEDLTERVMSRVRAVHEEQVLERARARSSASKADDETSPSLGDRARAGVSRLADPRKRRSVLAWGSAAAAVLIVAGLGASAGIRSLGGNAEQRAMTLADASGDEVAAESAASPAPDLEADKQTGTGYAQSAAGPKMIVVNGRVYRLLGQAPGVDSAGLHSLGTTRSGLDSGLTPAERTVLTGDDPERAYIVDGDTIYAFERVTRMYAGRVYVLESSAVDSFGTWPSLPSGRTRPTSPDGSPSLEVDGTDENGTTVYRAVGSDAGEGIAIGPGAATPDPVAGAPDWTWWTPLGQ